MDNNEVFDKMLEVVNNQDTDAEDTLKKVRKKVQKKTKKKVVKKKAAKKETIKLVERKVLPFKEIHKERQNDYDYMVEMKAAYDKNVDNLETNSDYRQISNKVYTLKQAAEKQIAKMERDVTKAEKLKEKLEGGGPDDMAADIERFKAHILKKDLYFVGDENRFYRFGGDELGWIPTGVDATYRLGSAILPNEKVAFSAAMDELERNKTSALYSFRSSNNPDVLDLMRKESWLQPEEGDIHPLFRLITLSLAGGREDIADHIEQIVYWKYWHPEDYQIPCLVITGSGGVGKNEFVQGPLATIFGKSQVICMPFNMAFGDYTGERRGKTVVFVDEVVSSKSDANHMKSVVGNAYANVNIKGGKQSSIENTPLYLVGGNDKSGAFLLDGTEADRRWSIISVNESMMPHFRRANNFKLIENPETGVEPEQEAIDWWEKNRWVLEDAEQVSHWLMYIIMRWSGKCKTRPSGWHGEDYKIQRDKQMTPTDEFSSIIFGDEDFTFISSTECWELFEYWVSKNANSLRGKIRRTNSLRTIREWVFDNTDVEGGLSYKVKDFEGNHISEFGFSKGGRTSWGEKSSYLKYDEESRKTVFSRKYQKALVNFEKRTESVKTKINPAADEKEVDLAGK